MKISKKQLEKIKRFIPIREKTCKNIEPSIFKCIAVFDRKGA